jgi:hypothetical protein
LNNSHFSIKKASEYCWQAFTPLKTHGRYPFMCLTNSKFDQIGVLAPFSRCSIIIENPPGWENDLSIAPMSSTNSKFDKPGLYLTASSLYVLSQLAPSLTRKYKTRFKFQKVVKFYDIEPRLTSCKKIKFPIFLFFFLKQKSKFESGKTRLSRNHFYREY